MIEKMYTVKEVAEYLRISEKVIRKDYIPNGIIKAVKYKDSDKAPWMIPESEIERLQRGN
jgi:predicted site-specific integrase-resolvase